MKKKKHFQQSKIVILAKSLMLIGILFFLLCQNNFSSCSCVYFFLSFIFSCCFFKVLMATRVRNLKFATSKTLVNFIKKMMFLSHNWYFSVQKALIYYTFNKSHHNSFIISPDESRGYIGFRSVAPPLPPP